MAAAMAEPSLRIRALTERASAVNVDNETPVKRYYRSGMEIERMANGYYADGDWEPAFILYSRFITYGCFMVF
jgi:STAM-binding protein